MARYKHIDTSPRFLAVDLQRQLLPGTFEYALNHLLDNELDLSDFDSRFNNDVAGATAFRLPCCLKSFCLPMRSKRRDITRHARSFTSQPEQYFHAHHSKNHSRNLKLKRERNSAPEKH